MAIQARKLLPPAAKKGETYAGIVFKKGKPKYHLFKRLAEQDGVEFAAARDLKDDAGGVAPNRDDLRVMHISIPHKFKTDKPYWSNEEHAGDRNYAWYQWFNYGYQDYWSKGYKSRACLVRRVPI